MFQKAAIYKEVNTILRIGFFNNVQIYFIFKKCKYGFIYIYICNILYMVYIYGYIYIFIFIFSIYLYIN